ncbi:unnamed protein product [Amoebophrya sp. A25]|nr:unnamed protein product [Amoebophrya sp. A25]|eukprot:GSA25T00021826001.1
MFEAGAATMSPDGSDDYGNKVDAQKLDCCNTLFEKLDDKVEPFFNATTSLLFTNSKGSSMLTQINSALADLFSDDVLTDRKVIATLAKCPLILAADVPRLREWMRSPACTSSCLWWLRRVQDHTHPACPTNFPAMAAAELRLKIRDWPDRTEKLLLLWGLAYMEMDAREFENAKATLQQLLHATTAPPNGPTPSPWKPTCFISELLHLFALAEFGLDDAAGCEQVLSSSALFFKDANDRHHVAHRMLQTWSHCALSAELSASGKVDSEQAAKELQTCSKLLEKSKKNLEKEYGRELDHACGDTLYDGSSPLWLDVCIFHSLKIDSSKMPEQPQMCGMLFRRWKECWGPLRVQTSEMQLSNALTHKLLTKFLQPLSKQQYEEDVKKTIEQGQLRPASSLRSSSRGDKNTTTPSSNGTASSTSTSEDEELLHYRGVGPGRCHFSPAGIRYILSSGQYHKMLRMHLERDIYCVTKPTGGKYDSDTSAGVDEFRNFMGKTFGVVKRFRRTKREQLEEMRAACPVHTGAIHMNMSMWFNLNVDDVAAAMDVYG